MPHYPNLAQQLMQFNPLVNNFGDIEKRKQFGNMLYVRADYTSQTDPITGWVKTIYIKKGSEKAIRDRIKKSFSDINFDGKNYIFEYKDSNNKKWKLYSGWMKKIEGFFICFC